MPSRPCRDKVLVVAAINFIFKAQVSDHCKLVRLCYVLCLCGGGGGGVFHLWRGVAAAAKRPGGRVCG